MSKIEIWEYGYINNALISKYGNIIQQGHIETSKYGNIIQKEHIGISKYGNIGIWEYGNMEILIIA